MAHTKKPSPDTGKVAAIAVGRGKSEQIRIVLKKPLLFVPYGRVVAEWLRFFIIGAQKNFSCLSREGAEKKSFYLPVLFSLVRQSPLSQFLRKRRRCSISGTEGNSCSISPMASFNFNPERKIMR